MRETRHDLVLRRTDRLQARCAAVERKADRIEDRRLSRTRGSGDREDTAVRVRRMCEIDMPCAGKRVEIRKL